MAIPDFQSLMLPVLRLAGDGAEHRSDEYYEAVARQFGLTPEERAQLLRSGKQPLYVNRAAWAITHLAKAGLLERTGRGRTRITEQGRQVLASDTPRVDMAYLSRYPAYVEFRRRSKQSDDLQPAVSQEVSRTPDELLESSYLALRAALALELLDRIKAAPPAFFERVVVDLLVAMGYGGSRQDAGHAVGRSGDGGIDGIIKEDKLGLDFVYLQAKRWDSPVGRPTVQGFAGSLEGQRARKGVLITTSKFTPEAQEYVTRTEKRIVLMDGEMLAQMMIDHGVGVANVASYQVKRVDAEYFGDE